MDSSEEEKKKEIKHDGAEISEQTFTDTVGFSIDE